MPKVSIIVPVYKVEKYLPKCLDSLVNQTLDDYEIIVVNDGSPDNSQSIIDNYAANYPDKIKPFKKKNGGLSDARNFGMSKATGDFIGFVDSDDFVSAEMFKTLYDKAISTDSDIVVCAYNSVKLGVNGDIKKSRLGLIENAYKFGKSIYESPDILPYSRSFAWNKLYKREILKGYEFPVGQLYEDSAVVYNILSSAKKIEVVNTPLYYYVTSRKGAITSSIDKRIFDIFKSCGALIEFYKKIGKYDEFKEQIEYLCLTHICDRRFIIFTKNGSLKLKLKYVDRTFDFLKKNIPNWRNNQYYLKRRAPKIATHPIDKFDLACEYRNSLKRFYIFLYIKNLPQKIGEHITRIYNGVMRRLTRVPKISKAAKAAAKELSGKELRELQLVTVNILKTVVEFCNKNNIRYYLSEGSLLGAIRHGGFIPWDDDLDIAMPREDYERFLKLWGNDIHDQCRLFHQSTYKKYYLTFAKVIFTGECRFSSLIRQGLKSMNEVKGPGIDIFPLDETTPLTRELVARASKIRKYRNILLTKVYYLKTPDRRKGYRLAAALMSYKSLHKKLVALYTADRNKGEKYITNFASSYNITKEIFPKDLFEPAREIEFEGLTVTIPNKSEDVLTQIYGDYMTPPPVSQRVCPHKYIVKK